jgi:tRNA/rRNA methyltransferase
MPLPHPVIILVRPQLGENIGMAARAMRNFGLEQLRIVAPRDGWGVESPVMQAALDAAVGAGEIIAQAPLFASITDAIGDLSYVYATTARDRGQGKAVVAPAEEMPSITSRVAGGQGVGILFGPERTGLTNDDVSLADAVMSFPVNPAFASLNLAQAVLLVGYDWFRHAVSATPPIALMAEDEPASRAALLAMFEDLEQRLAGAGYFRNDAKVAIMKRNLRNILHRFALGEQDVKTLRGVIRALSEPRKGKQDESPGGLG